MSKDNLTGDNANRVKGDYTHPEFTSMPLTEIQSKASQFDIDSHLVSLVMTEPFYGDVIRSLHKTLDRGLPTAGVICKNETFRLYYNDLFLGPYSNEVVRGIMMHEAMHLVLQHTTVRRYEPFEIWNWATDLAINGSIPRRLLPNIGLIPGERPNLGDLSRMTEDQRTRMNAIADLIASLPTDLSSEEYFGILMDNPDVQKNLEEQKAGGEGFGIPMDDHDGWGDLSDEEREYLNEKVRQIVKEAQQKADEKNTWGSVPAHMREEIRRIVNGEIDWRALLRQFAGQQQRADRIGSIHRLNKKYPGIHSGFTRDHRPSIGVFLDQSGSVSDLALELFFGELPSLSRLADFVVYNFDTSVDEDSGVKWSKSLPPKRLTRTRCGGTDFDAVTRFLESPKGRRHRFEAVIILTDGGAPKPESARGHRRCWILEPGTDLYFKDADTRDVVIKLKKNRKN